MFLAYFFETFQMEYDVTSIGIRVILVQEERAIVYFNNRLSNVILKYSTNDKELCGSSSLVALKRLSYWSRVGSLFKPSSFKFFKTQKKLILNMYDGLFT